MDDNGDGLIDLQDTLCICETITPISLIPNPSFEEINCCPSGRAELNCATGWIQASAPTTDLLHSCGWYGFNNFPVPQPIPDGEGLMGFRDGRVIQNNNPEPNWKEYAGACLTLPLLTRESYRFEFSVGFVNRVVSPEIEITFFGSPSCSNLPFGGSDIAFGCPTNGEGWVELGSVRVRGDNEWVQTKIDITPSLDIHAIAIGPPCRGTSANVSTYYFFDNLVLADEESFTLSIQEINHPCQPNFALEIPQIEGATFQWYLNDIALPGAISSIYTPTTPGTYRVRIDSDEGCRLTKEYEYFIPVINHIVQERRCAAEEVIFGPNILTSSGIYVDTFVSFYGCDSIVTLDLTFLDEYSDSVYYETFAGESIIVDGMRITREGLSIISVRDDAGCLFDRYVFIDFIELMAPNVFSPNEDGHNDIFSLFASNSSLILESFIIYDRWGNKVYHEGGLHVNEMRGWDGTHKGELLPVGVYSYLAFLKNDLQQIQPFTGSILLLR